VLINLSRKPSTIRHNRQQLKVVWNRLPPFLPIEARRAAETCRLNRKTTSFCGQLHQFTLFAPGQRSPNPTNPPSLPTDAIAAQHIFKLFSHCLDQLDSFGISKHCSNVILCQINVIAVFIP
jgi:hypothetical protein